MRAVVDTNVLMSGVFFGGVPGRVLEAWHKGRFTLVITPLILDEYRRVAHELCRSADVSAVDAILDLITIHAELVEDTSLAAGVCRDPNDDIFLSCACAARAVVVSGDKDVLAAHGVNGMTVLSPRAFLERISQA